MDADDHNLPHMIWYGIEPLVEIEEYDETTDNELIAWVRVPVLSRSRDTVITIHYGNDDPDALKEFNLLTAKPVMYIANVDEGGFENNPHLDAVKEYAAAEGAEVVAICAAIEAEIAQLDEEDKKDFLADLGFDEPGLNRVIRSGYKLLGLETFFTAGPKEVRAWTTKIGATAPEAAGEIHTDFQKGFIRAEVIGYDDFVANNGEHGAKEAGRLRLEGKEYIVQEADVMHFRFNV